MTLNHCSVEEQQLILIRVVFNYKYHQWFIHM